MNSLLHTKILMRISDPWELGQALHWEAFDAEIVGVRGDNLLIRLVRPFFFKETVCEYFVASPRHERDHVDKLSKGQSLFCGLTRIPSDQAHSNDPFNLADWRGGIAAIGNLDPTLRLSRESLKE